MKGFLARWAEGEAAAPAQGHGDGTLNTRPIVKVASESDAARPGLETLPTETGTRSTSGAERTADELNKPVEEHCVTRKRGRLTADTVRRRHLRNKPDEEGGLNLAGVLQAARLCGDSMAAEAISEIAGLLATAYRRCSPIRRVGADPRKDSGDAGLANSGAPSVHGVVP
jgi:hypothetical protein